MVLNFLILGLSGSIGVAAYGVVANVAIVATAIFSGISQGSQPLLSDAYSRGETGQVRQVLMMSILTALTLSVLMIVCFEVFAEPLVAVFNSEHDPVMADLAYCTGKRNCAQDTKSLKNDRHFATNCPTKGSKKPAPRVRAEM